MTARSSTHRVARAAALVAGAAAVIVAACEAPRPDPVGPQQGRVAQANTNLDTQIRALVAQHFPEIARGDTSSRPMMFLLASDRHVLGTARGPSVANAHFKTPSSDASVTMPESAHIDSAHVKTHLEMARTSHPDMVEEHSLMSKIDPNWIESVDVRKYKAGEIGPNAAAAIVIVLKPGAPDPTR